MPQPFSAAKPPKWLTEAAQVSQDMGVTITIEHQSRVYRIVPGAGEHLSGEADLVNWSRK